MVRENRPAFGEVTVYSGTLFGSQWQTVRFVRQHMYMKTLITRQRSPPTMTNHRCHSRSAEYHVVFTDRSTTGTNASPVRDRIRRSRERRNDIKYGRLLISIIANHGRSACRVAAASRSAHFDSLHVAVRQRKP